MKTTCPASITAKEKQILLDKKIVLCKEICNNHQLLLNAGVSSKRLVSILKEANALCEGRHEWVQ